MHTSSSTTTTSEFPGRVRSGGPMLLLSLGVLLFGLILLIRGIAWLPSARGGVLLVAGPLLELCGIILLCGHFTLQPNEARVLILFGRYCGTVRTSGFYWSHPFFSRNRAKLPIPGAEPMKNAQGQITVPTRTLSAKISLRARNFVSEKLKVNDKSGNPVEIAAVIVWHVEDTARAAFDVDDFESYVQIQSEAAIRHTASQYGYDHSEEHELTLRESTEEVAAHLQRELSSRLEKAGLAIDEARLTHLAYAPEIAQTMLRRQQAEAVIAARQMIVKGAVSMVEMALHELSEKKVVELDEERKASMVSNLLVVLCGESEAKPVINAGTLYN